MPISEYITLGDFMVTNAKFERSPAVLAPSAMILSIRLVNNSIKRTRVLEIQNISRVGIKLYYTTHYTTLHSTTLHYITLHYTTLHYTLHRTALHYITLHYITLHYITLHYIALHCIALHYITLHYITLHYITLHYITYYILYHDCSDLSHALVFTITWQKRNQVISWYKTNIDCSIFGGWLNLLPLGALETATIFPWAFGPRENSSGLQSTSGK